MSEDNATVTVSEFKNWLSGVLDFQPEDWVPDAGQWEKILGKINSLDETVVQQPLSSENKPAPVQHNPRPVPRNPRPQAPLDGGTVKLPDKSVKKVPAQVTVQDTGDMSVIEEGGKKIVNTGKIYKTGQIDTSSGEYTSQFS